MCACQTSAESRPPRGWCGHAAGEWRHKGGVLSEGTSGWNHIRRGSLWFQLSASCLWHWMKHLLRLEVLIHLRVITDHLGERFDKRDLWKRVWIDRNRERRGNSYRRHKVPHSTLSNVAVANRYVGDLDGRVGHREVGFQDVRLPGSLDLSPRQCYTARTHDVYSCVAFACDMEWPCF